MKEMQDKFDEVIRVYEQVYMELNKEVNYSTTKQDILNKFEDYNFMDGESQSNTWEWFIDYIKENKWSKKYLYFFIHENFYNGIDHGILGHEFYELEDKVKYEIWQHDFNEIDTADIEFWKLFWSKVFNV